MKQTLRILLRHLVQESLITLSFTFHTLAANRTLANRERFWSSSLQAPRATLNLIRGIFVLAFAKVREGHLWTIQEGNLETFGSCLPSA